MNGLDSIGRERISTFIASLDPPEDEFQAELRLYAKEHGVPIAGLETENLLVFFVQLLRPKRILEVGTAIAYSSITMAKQMPEGCMIDTIENYPPRIEEAKKNIQRSGMQERIALHEGDAAQILPVLSGPYDLIFMDAAKGQYVRWLPDVLRLLSERGILISDNVLQDGDVLKERLEVRRRDRTIHKRMNEYLHVLKNTEGLSSVILSEGDGIALTVKTGTSVKVPDEHIINETTGGT